jgi:hypothetical protein
MLPLRDRAASIALRAAGHDKIVNKRRILRAPFLRRLRIIILHRKRSPPLQDEFLPRRLRLMDFKHGCSSVPPNGIIDPARARGTVPVLAGH